MVSKTAMDAGPIEVRPLTLHIGAEIDGVDLTRPLSPKTVGDIRAACCRVW